MLRKQLSPIGIAVPACVLITSAGFAIRYILADMRPFFGDDCGTLKHLCQPWMYILTRFDLWLTMNCYLLAQKVVAHMFGEGFLALRMLAILSGTGTILMGALLAFKLFGRASIAVIAALLLAANPYLINFSANTRSYSLFTLLSLALWLALLRWQKNMCRLNAIMLALLCLLLPLTHLNAAFLIPWLVAAILLEGLRARHSAHESSRWLKGIKTLCLPAALCCGAACAYYALLMRQILRHNRMHKEIGSGFLADIPNVFNIYCGSTHSPVIGWTAFALLALGLLYSWRKQRTAAIWAVFWVSIPLVANVALGYSFRLHDFARFMIFSLPILLVFIAAGIVHLNDMCRAPLRTVPAVLTSAIILFAWIPRTATLFVECDRFPMHRAYAHIMGRIKPADRIIGMEPYTKLHLSPYMPCDQRLEASDETWRLIWAVPLLMQDPEDGRIFVVSCIPELPLFSDETVFYGDVRITILPAETAQQRYARLLDGYERAERKLAEKAKKPEFFLIYEALKDLAALRGDEDAASSYSALAQECLPQSYRNIEKQ